MKKPLIEIEVVSDVVCPWCYIGKRRMEKAVAQLSNEFEFRISYSPFELNPHIPEKGLDQKAYLTDKFGGEVQYQQITSRVSQTAAEEGLKFDFSKQHVSPNTRHAHRIIRFAKQKGKQEAVKEAFMKAYFEDGVDLSSHDNLATVAEAAGLNRKEVLELLNSDTGLAEIKQLEQINIQRGISGVPFFIINNKYGFSGAQPTAVFQKAFQQVATELTTTAEQCEVDTKDC
ncbi:MAG TPA: DsbA family oxidoreductase [Cyclobacteriaceae bacterium]|nr:DsbA family oxidoreductase [Cyclobacteriaceae bacterium]